MFSAEQREDAGILFRSVLKKKHICVMVLQDSRGGEGGGGHDKTIKLVSSLQLSNYTRFIS